MGIIKAIEIKAKLTLLKESIIRKHTIQEPKTKDEALKPIPKTSRDAINTLSIASDIITRLIELNEAYAKELDKNDRAINLQSLSYGKLSQQNKKLIEEIKRLKIKNENLIRGL